MKVSGIYCIVHLPTGKKYVGQSVDLCSRRGAHFSKLRQGTHRNVHLQAAYNLYGSSEFEFRILEECSEGMLDIRECEWIAYYCSTRPEFGYNLESGGSFRKHLSLETRAKIKAAMIGTSMSEISRRALLAANTGRRMSENTRQAIVASRAGVPTSPEVRIKISRALKGRHKPPFSEAHRKHLSAALRGKPKRPQTAEHRRKTSEARKRYCAAKRLAASNILTDPIV